MVDIKIVPDELAKTIQILNEDNKEIYKTIKKIKDVILEMDETKWKSGEKKKIVEELIPYIENQGENAYNQLSNCVFTINFALNKYIESNHLIKSNVSILDFNIREE